MPGAIAFERGDEVQSSPIAGIGRGAYLVSPVLSASPTGILPDGGYLYASGLLVPEGGLDVDQFIVRNVDAWEGGAVVEAGAYTFDLATFTATKVLTAGRADLVAPGPNASVVVGGDEWHLPGGWVYIYTAWFHGSNGTVLGGESERNFFTSSPAAALNGVSLNFTNGWIYRWLDGASTAPDSFTMDPSAPDVYGFGPIVGIRTA